MWKFLLASVVKKQVELEILLIKLCWNQGLYSGNEERPGTMGTSTNKDSSQKDEQTNFFLKILNKF